MSTLTDIISNKENLYSGDLKHYFKCLFNSRGAANPYHNIRHSCTVLVRCYEGLKYMVLFGLSEEMGVTPIEMLRMQEGFLKNLKFESQWGREKFTGEIEKKIQEAKELLQILS